jgi:predicted RNA-binding Zn ribbon-like protein
MVLVVTKENSHIFQFLGGNLALNFCNTVHSVGDEDPQDDLETCADLLSWAMQAGLIKQGTSIAGEHERLARFKDLRGALHRIFSELAAGGKPGPELLARFNAHLHAALAQAHIENAGGAYRLNSQDKKVAAKLHFEITKAAADLLTDGPIDRVRQCAGQSCSWLFMDTSRNRSRRWCEMKACGNRAKVRRFRQHEHD